MRPTLQELKQTIQADMGPSKVRYSLKDIFAKGIAGLTHSLYGYVDLQIEGRMPDSARKDMLERWAKVWGYKRNPATFASGLIVVIASEGIELEAGTSWLHESGYEYALTEATSLIPGENRLKVICLKEGQGGNRAKGDLLTITKTLAGVESKATVISIEGGYETESDASLRSRFLRRLALPPQGGAVHDYIDWAESLPDVFKAWVDPIPGGQLGHVALTFLTPDIERPRTSLEQAQKVLSELEKIKPTGSRLDVKPPKLKEVSVNITKLEPTSLLEEVKQAIHRVFEANMVPTAYLDAYREKQEARITPYNIFLAVSQIEGLKEIEFTPKETIKASNKGEMLVLKEVTFEGNL